MAKPGRKLKKANHGRRPANAKARKAKVDFKIDLARPLHVIEHEQVEVGDGGERSGTERHGNAGAHQFRNRRRARAQAAVAARAPHTMTAMTTT